MLEAKTGEVFILDGTLTIIAGHNDTLTVNLPVQLTLEPGNG